MAISMVYFAYGIHYAFLFYTVLLAIRIIGSWFPRFWGNPWMQLLGKVVDPYLNIFRRLLPPIGGRLDLSPMLAFISLTLLEKFILLLLF